MPGRVFFSGRVMLAAAIESATDSQSVSGAEERERERRATAEEMSEQGSSQLL